MLITGAAAWYGALRRGLARVVGLIVAGLGLAGALVLLVTRGAPLVDLVVVGGLLVSLAAARAAFTVHVDLPSASAPRQPVLVYNPKSGGGKAERFALVQEAGRRGIEAVELRRGDDLEALVRAAVARGADGLAMAGGDGSQAVVAAVAAELGCHTPVSRPGRATTSRSISASTATMSSAPSMRSSMAVSGGSTSARSTDGCSSTTSRSGSTPRQYSMRATRREDPHRAGHGARRLGPTGDELDLRWRGPGGHEHRGGAAVLVSNNAYRLGHALGSGTRPRIDDGLLGITVFGAITWQDEEGRALQRPWRAWSSPTFEVSSDKPIAAGIDGEALVLDAPLEFRIRPKVLRVHVARQHPGASPSAMAPEGVGEAMVGLVRIAFGRYQKP